MENTFGIFAHSWRVLLITIQLFPRRAQKVTCGCIVSDVHYTGLHAPDPDWDDEKVNIISGAWRPKSHALGDQMVGPQVIKERKQIRVYIKKKNMYNSEQGRLPWQDAII